MPSKKDYKSQGDELMMRAAWDVCQDLFRLYGVEVHMQLRPTLRKGVYLVVAVATAAAPHWAEEYSTRYSREWPRSEVMSLAAAQFAACNHIHAQVESCIACGSWRDLRTAT